MTATLDFEAATLKDLQAAAREKSKAEGKALTWIAGARKETLQAFLTGEEPAAHEGNGHNKQESDLAGMIAAAVAPLIKATGFDREAALSLVREEIAKARLARPVTVNVTTRDQSVSFARSHKALPELLTVLECGLHAWMIGPAGSGKTTLAHQAALSLKLNFKALSVSAQTPISALMGYMNATGVYVRTAFRECFEHGGLFVLDEADNGNPNTLTVLNAALANGVCSFPDDNVQIHPDFRLVACANTWGLGATALYVGRQQIDAPTLDRFVFLSIGYDEVLERECAGNDEWVTRVQAFRKAADAQKVRTVISPRASIAGAKLLAAGWSREQVEAALIYKGLGEDGESKLRKAVN
jgi:cobaltochelatase CobS